MHVEQRSAEVAEMRRKRIDDIQKRNAYRAAHGIKDPQGVWGFGRRLEYYADKEDMEKHSEESVNGSPAEEASPVGTEAVAESGEFVDFEGKKQRRVKKWFGIWG